MLQGNSLRQFHVQIISAMKLVIYVCSCIRELAKICLNRRHICGEMCSVCVGSQEGAC